MIPPTVSTITRCAYNLLVTFHKLVLRSNHECLRLKRVESRRISVEYLLARIRQAVCDEVHDNVPVAVRNYLGAALSDDFDYDDSWLERSDSD